MFIDFAIKKLIPPGANDPQIEARMGIFHVDANNTFSLHDYFNGPSGGIESHGHIRRDGMLEQYRDTAYEADANYRANPFALSFETQGYEMGEWNDAQLKTIKRTILWGNKNHDIPLRVPTTWNDSRGGWGYHTMFSEWHPEAKSCPGPMRKAQFHDIIVPWMNEGEDMSFTKQDRQKLDRIAADTANISVGIRLARKAERIRDRELRKVLAERYKITSADLDAILRELGVD